MKKRTSKKLALNKLTVRPLNHLDGVNGGIYASQYCDEVSLGNTRCSRTEADDEVCMNTL